MHILQPSIIPVAFTPVWRESYNNTYKSCSKVVVGILMRGIEKIEHICCLKFDARPQVSFISDLDAIKVAITFSFPSMSLCRWIRKKNDCISKKRERNEKNSTKKETEMESLTRNESLVQERKFCSQERDVQFPLGFQEKMNNNKK